MKLGDGAGLAPGTTLASNRGGWRWTAASLMGDLRTENDPILNITGRAPVPASIRVAADTAQKSDAVGGLAQSAWPRLQSP